MRPRRYPLLLESSDTLSAVRREASISFATRGDGSAKFPVRSHPAAVRESPAVVVGERWPLPSALFRGRPPSEDMDEVCPDEPIEGLGEGILPLSERRIWPEKL